MAQIVYCKNVVDKIVFLKCHILLMQSSATSLLMVQSVGSFVHMHLSRNSAITLLYDSMIMGTLVNRC